MIDAYRGVKEKHPDVQLALVGSMAHDDPEGWEFYNQTVSYADGDPDIFILSNLNNIGSVEVNAFQVHSAAVIQKSIREGFGLTVTEGLWKGRPTVAGAVGGIVAQIEDGVTGWLVNSSAECAAACLEILADPTHARELALRGQGTRSAPLPDTSSAPGLACALQPPCRQRRGRDAASHRSADGLQEVPRSSRVLRCPRVLAEEVDRRLQPRPLTYGREGGERVARRGGGGLVTALRSLLAEHDVTWIASAMTDEDRAVAAEARGAAIEERSREGAAYRLRLVAHDESAYDWYYNVISNPTLWFLQHYLWNLAHAPEPSIRGSTTRGRRATSR